MPPFAHPDEIRSSCHCGRHLWLVVVLAIALAVWAFPAAAAEPEVTLTVINRTDVDICYLYLSAVGSDDWGPDRLGPKGTISPGDSLDVTLTPGRYDARAEDCDGEMLAEVHGADIRADRKWTIRPKAGQDSESNTDAGDEREDDRQPAPPTPRPTVVATPMPVTLDQFLCCGQSVGGTMIWSIRYPRGWEIEYFGTPREFVGAAIFDPAGTIRITFLPSGTPEAGGPLDTGEIESLLDGLVQVRQSEDPGFQEFLREPVPGLPDARLWGGTWPGETQPMWEVYFVQAASLGYVAPQLPRTYMTIMGMRAAASDWATGGRIYEQMLSTAKLKWLKDDSETDATELGGPAVDAGMVRFCPKECAWEWISAAVGNWACPVYGEESYAYEVPCE